jgi:hypothetical protein
MSERKSVHSFHIPVMGTGYTVDTPIKVAHLGINSVISIVDHRLTERMREYHSNLRKLPFEPIPERAEDSRAKRITAYLNLVDKIVADNFKAVKESDFKNGSEITKYFELLPDTSDLKRKYKTMRAGNNGNTAVFGRQLKEEIAPGSIDVNIMTKLDRVNYAKKNDALSNEFNDAHAALRGFANSTLRSSVVFSAGMNPRLYGYASTFLDFYPDENGKLKKKIILKVSDYRSALIQGKFLAKKGLWVSEFRIESGLNCGGHAFATDGYLLGPILEEFKTNRNELIDTLFELYSDGLDRSERMTVNEPPPMRITVQGGVGTHQEHNFLMECYGVDSVGWGTPFLLVPEVVNIDERTLQVLCDAEEEDLYLSEVSPLGVPFNTVRGNTAELEKQRRIEAGTPGAPCLKQHLVFNTEFSDNPICTASRVYQNAKIKDLESRNLGRKELKKAISEVVEKMCLCVGLGNPALISGDIQTHAQSQGVSVCPGPNIAYFSKIVSLNEMVDHIYGRINLMNRKDRPHMFINELKLYIDYLKSRIERSPKPLTDSQVKYFDAFHSKLNEGIVYYKNLAERFSLQLDEIAVTIQNGLAVLEEELNAVVNGEDLRLVPVVGKI